MQKAKIKEFIVLRSEFIEKPAGLVGIDGENEVKIYINLKKQSQFLKG